MISGLPYQHFPLPGETSSPGLREQAAIAYGAALVAQGTMTNEEAIAAKAVSLADALVQRLNSTTPEHH